ETFDVLLAAYAAYQLYLQVQRLYEVCQASPTSCNQQELERRRAASQTKGTQVQGILKNLTELETTRNTERTFDVSDVFTLPGQDVSDRTIRDVVDTVADWMITLASSLAVTALIIGGFMMIISGGDENRLETGKTIFSYSLMGLFVTLMAYGIVTFLQSLFY